MADTKATTKTTQAPYEKGAAERGRKDTIDAEDLPHVRAEAEATEAAQAHAREAIEDAAEVGGASAETRLRLSKEKMERGADDRDPGLQASLEEMQKQSEDNLRLQERLEDPNRPRRGSEKTATRR